MERADQLYKSVFSYYIICFFFKYLIDNFSHAALNGKNQMKFFKERKWENNISCMMLLKSLWQLITSDYRS